MPGRLIQDDKARETTYHVVTAALAIAGIWGVITAEQVADYGQAVLMLLGIGGTELAAANTPSRKAKAEVKEAEKRAEDDAVDPVENDPPREGNGNV